MSNAKHASVKVSFLARKPATSAMLVDVSRLVTAYYTDVPDSSVHEQRVAFGTAGHRGSAFENILPEIRDWRWGAQRPADSEKK